MNARNLIRNAHAEVAQRGASVNVTTTKAYTVDGWCNLAGGSAGAATIAREALAVTDAPCVADAARYCVRHNQTTPGAGTQPCVEWRMEAPEQTSGREVTWAFWAKAAAAGLTAQVVLAADTGSGGSPSADPADMVIATLAIATEWTYYTGTAALHRLDGLTLGTDGNAWSALSVQFPAGVAFDVRVAAPRLMLGRMNPDDARLQPPDLTAEWDDALRFYQRWAKGSSGADLGIGGGQAYTTTAARMNLIFMRPMRATPSVVTASPAQFTLTNAAASGVAATTLTSANPRTTSCMLTFGVASGLVAGNATEVYIGGSSGSVSATAEL